MPSIDESIRKIDNVICRHLDEIENNSRGAISQDILEQLTKFINHVMLKFYANGREIPITAENIAKAIEFAQINSELYTLYKFHNYLEVVTTQYTLDEDGSERLMLKYYQYLLEAKNLVWHYFGIEVLHNLDKFPLHLDDTLQEYYKKNDIQWNSKLKKMTNTIFRKLSHCLLTDTYIMKSHLHQ